MRLNAPVHAKSERRHRLCLARFPPELDRHGVHEVYLEGRETKQNARDMQDPGGGVRVRKEGWSDLRLYHQPGPRNALLWIPDVVAGAVGAGRAGGTRGPGTVSGRGHVLRRLNSAERPHL